MGGRLSPAVDGPQGVVKVFPELSNKNCDHGSHVEASRPVYLLQGQSKRPQDLLASKEFFQSKLACFTLRGSETNSALRATAAGVAARASRTRGKPVELSEPKKNGRLQEMPPLIRFYPPICYRSTLSAFFDVDKKKHFFSNRSIHSADPNHNYHARELTFASHTCLSGNNPFSFFGKEISTSLDLEHE